MCLSCIIVVVPNRTALVIALPGKMYIESISIFTHWTFTPKFFPHESYSLVVLWAPNNFLKTRHLGGLILWKHIFDTPKLQSLFEKSIVICIRKMVGFWFNYPFDKNFKRGLYVFNFGWEWQTCLILFETEWHLILIDVIFSLVFKKEINKFMEVTWWSKSDPLSILVDIKIF